MLWIPQYKYCGIHNTGDRKETYKHIQKYIYTTAIII